MVKVNPVNIPLPNRGVQINPVASDSPSQLPTRSPEQMSPAKERVLPQVTEAIPIPSERATKMPPWYHTEEANEFRKEQKAESNHLYGKATALGNPNREIPGGGGPLLSGTNSAFGSQFGAYADLLVQQVGRHWNKPALTTGGTRHTTVSFTLHRDGKVADVKITETSGIPSLDYSAQRAILEAAPFPPFPSGFNKTETGIDFIFELKR